MQGKLDSCHDTQINAVRRGDFGKARFGCPLQKESPAQDRAALLPSRPKVEPRYTGNVARGDSVSDGWRMKDTDRSSGAITSTLFWGRLGLFIFFFRL